MSKEKILEIVQSELEISGISDMSIEEEVKSSKKEFGVLYIFSLISHGFFQTNLFFIDRVWSDNGPLVWGWPGPGPGLPGLVVPSLGRMLIFRKRGFSRNRRTRDHAAWTVVTGLGRKAD